MQFASMTKIVSGMRLAIQEAGNTCMIIVAGQLAGFGSKCMDKWFLREGNSIPAEETGNTERTDKHDRRARPEPNSTNEKRGEQTALKERKAHELKEKLTSHVSTPNEPII